MIKFLPVELPLIPEIALAPVLCQPDHDISYEFYLNYEKLKPSSWLTVDETARKLFINLARFDSIGENTLSIKAQTTPKDPNSNHFAVKEFMFKIRIINGCLKAILNRPKRFQTVLIEYGEDTEVIKAKIEEIEDNICRDYSPATTCCG